MARQGRFSQANGDIDPDYWGLIVSAWLGSMILLGGISVASNWALLTHLVLSYIVLVFGLWRLRFGFKSKSAIVGTVIVTSSLFLTLLHLVPLPYSLWASLPGHQLNVDMFKIIGVTPDWLPLSLSPLATKATALALIPALAGYFASLTLRPSGYWKISLVIVACAVVSLVIGLAQKSMGPSSGLYFYGAPSTNIASGTFANRNFFAAQLFTSIPFLAALATTLSHSRRLHPSLVLVFAFIYMALLVVGLAITGSRGGIILAFVSVLLSVLYVYRHPVSSGSGTNSRLKIYAVLACFVLIVQVGMLGITRLAQTDPVQDYRSDIYAVTLTAIRNYFPVGSGFGSFAQVYQQFETPAIIVASYINHAHNDWLEIALEGGIPAFILLSIFAALYIALTVSISRMAFSVPQHVYFRASVVTVFLMLMHSMVDFSLRTPALLSLFSVCCGILVNSQARGRSSELQVKGHAGKPKNPIKKQI
jgi:O-antigen ligase